VDWREKLKATRKGSKKGPSAVPSPEAASPAAPSQAATSPPQPGEAADLGMTADGKPNLGLLSKGLPAGWQAMWDKNTGDIYYGNLKSRVRFCLPQLRGHTSRTWHLTLENKSAVKCILLLCWPDILSAITVMVMCNANCMFWLPCSSASAISCASKCVIWARADQGWRLC